MHLLGTVLLMLCHSPPAFPVPLDAVIIQTQRWGLLGHEQVREQVLLNGVSLTDTSKEINIIIQTISAGAQLPTLSGFNQTSLLGNHTVLRSRECILEASQLHWTDRVFYDGKVYLTLDNNGTWMAHVPQALAIKASLNQDDQRTRAESISLEVGCMELMRELKLSDDQTVSGISLPPVLVPVLAVLSFMGLIIISFLLSKKWGVRYPGGVIGSVTHYPTNMAEMGPEKKATVT